MTCQASRDGNHRPFAGQLHKAAITKIRPIPHSQEYVIFATRANCYDRVVGRIAPTREVVAARLAQRYVKVHGMEVALMIPCYIDVFYPQVGIATLELLERLGVDVVYPNEQTCCGQPMEKQRLL
jgi:Fe-S oxidoreductase